MSETECLNKTKQRKISRQILYPDGQRAAHKVDLTSQDKRKTRMGGAQL